MNKKIDKKIDITFLDFDDLNNFLLNGGQARATFEVSKRLVRMGHNVTIVCSRFPGSKDGFNEGIFYRHIGLGSRFIRINNIFFFLALPFTVFRLKSDVIMECFTAPISTSFAPLFTKIPVIGVPTMFEAKEFSKKYHLPFHWIEWFGAKFYRYFLAYSPANKAKMESLNSRVFTKIIPNGVGEEMLEEKTTLGNYGFFIGRIDIIQKGLDLLLSACKLAGNKCPKIVLAGNGPIDEEEKLKKLIKNSNLSDRISFIGRVDGQRKAKLLADARFGIYTSRFEDFPLVPLEFTGFGKPLVCFDITGLRWIPHEVALKVPSFDVQKLSEALITMNEDTKKLSKMSEMCRPFAKKYGWNRIAEEYAELCQEVISIDKRRKSKKPPIKKVLVLGGAGFIGSIVSNYLYELGDEISIFDLLLYEKKIRTFYPFRLVKGDVRIKKDLEKEIARADVVVNLAALSNDPVSDIDSQLTWEINFESNKLIADLALKYGKRVVYASSCSVYGFAESGIFNEDSALNPVTLYGRTKVLSEEYYRSSGADAICLRFATAYGYTEKPRFDLVVNTMIGTAYFNRKITVSGGGQWRPLAHVKDIAQGIYLASHKENPIHRVYNVGSNEQNYTIIDLAKNISSYFPEAEVIEEKNNADIRSYQVDFTRIQKELGFEAEYSVDSAVKEFSDAFRSGKVESMVPDEYYRIKFLKNSGGLSKLKSVNGISYKLSAVNI